MGFCVAIICVYTIPSAVCSLIMDTYYFTVIAAPSSTSIHSAIGFLFEASVLLACLSGSFFGIY